MHEDWERAYIKLAFRIEKLSPGYVDAYFGPPDLKETVALEGITPAADLARQAAALLDQVAGRPLAPDRATFMAKQLRAMETFCRKLGGESFSLTVEAERFYDITPEFVPATQFEEALTLLNEALPGPGSPAEKLAAYRGRYELPVAENARVPALMRQAMAEVQRRAAGIWQLPPGEDFDLKTTTGQPWLAYNWYLGNYRSLVELNTDMPVDLSLLLEIMAHEGYPGHHTEKILKEHLWYRQHGHLDVTIHLYNAPQGVIAEGLATCAADQLFAPGEQERWLAAHIYPQVGITPVPVDAAKLQRALYLLSAVSGNAAFLLHDEQRSDEEVVAYMLKYQPTPEDRVRRTISFLRQYGAYVFTYYYGKKLLLPLLGGADRHQVFHRLLTEYVTPSGLVAR